MKIKTICCFLILNFFANESIADYQENEIKYSIGAEIGLNCNYSYFTSILQNEGISYTNFTLSPLIGISLNYHMTPKFSIKPKCSIYFSKFKVRNTDFDNIFENGSYIYGKYGYQYLDFGMDFIYEFYRNWNLGIGLNLLMTSLINFEYGQHLNFISNGNNGNTLNYEFSNSDLTFKQFSFPLNIRLGKIFYFENSSYFEIFVNSMIPSITLPQSSYNQTIITDQNTFSKTVNLYPKNIFVQLGFEYSFLNLDSDSKRKNRK